MAEATHRGHAIIEQVIADLKDSALAHLPSGRFTANWLACAATAYSPTRAAGALASTLHARTGTIRAQLINTPGRRSRHRRTALSYS